MQFICYPKCTTCQKAQKWLDAHAVRYEVRDIKQNRPGLEELKAWYQAGSLPLKRFFNTSGLQYKALSLRGKLPSMTQEEQLELLSTDGMLVKRPILVGEGFLLVGFQEAEWEARLGG